MTDLRVPTAVPAALPAPVPQPAPAQAAGSGSHDAEWSAALQRILADPRRVRVHYQPIVDLQRGVVRGYEALARFPEAPGVPTIAWFEAAARLGCAGALEAQVMTAALVARPLLVRNRFIAVNLSPTALMSDEVAAALASCPRLDSIVLELTDQAVAHDTLRLRTAVDGLRARGAGLAVDDGGAGYGSLDRIMALRPQFLKLDGSVTQGIADDPSRIAMVRTLSDLAARLEAWVVAEGIESDEQLAALARLGVPLGQGYALARPAPAMAEIDRDLVRRMRQRGLGGIRGTGVEPLLERIPAVPTDPDAVRVAFAAQPHLEHVVTIDAAGRPVGILDRITFDGGCAPREPLRILAATPLADVARRAMARPLASRWDPAVCVDDAGAYQGVVPLDRVMGALAGA